MLQNTGNTFSKPTGYTCSQLCRQAHEACGPMEIDSALSTVQTLKNELQDAKMAAAESQLKPLPGETVRWAGVCLLFYSCEAVFIWGLVCPSIQHFECKASEQPHCFRTALWQGLPEGPAAGAVSISSGLAGHEPVCQSHPSPSYTRHMPVLEASVLILWLFLRGPVQLTSQVWNQELGDIYNNANNKNKIKLFFKIDAACIINSLLSLVSQVFYLGNEWQ